MVIWRFCSSSIKSIAKAVPARDGERSPAPARRLSVIVVFPWSTWAMIPMLRICSLLETIFRMSAELLKRGNESYLSNRRDSANLHDSLLYVTQGNPCHLSSLLRLSTRYGWYPFSTFTLLDQCAGFGREGSRSPNQDLDDFRRTPRSQSR